MSILNVNVGLLGHVDSGKTSLAKRLSQISSTASFDKNPQSQERGITIDLGFSSFTAESENGRVQFTLVDCPGHASLIKTIIGGAQIIDFVILVVDITKGVQTQTAECLVITEIIDKKMIVALNKIDLLDESKRKLGIDKVVKKLKNTLKNTPFKDAPIIPTSSQDGFQEEINFFIKELLGMVREFKRFIDKPMLLSVDHCFLIKGKGTILTGTMIQGKLQLNDNIEIPSLKQTKKVKSIQMFRKDVTKAEAGDRVGVCVTQFDPESIERGLVSAPGLIKAIFAVIIDMKKVAYYSNKITSGSKYHVTIGYETVMAKITLFEKKDSFSVDSEYLLIDEFENSAFALIEFDHSVLTMSNSLMIGSKLDMDINTPSCRLVFYGASIFDIYDKDYHMTVLPKMKIFKYKLKSGIVNKMSNKNEIIASSLFKKETKMHAFTNLKIQLSTGENGIIESTFGQGGKVKVRIPEGLKTETEKILTKSKKEETRTEKVQVLLKFKRYIFDKDKKIVQN